MAGKPRGLTMHGDQCWYVGLERNLVWRHFMLGHDGVEFDDEHERAFPADLAADLRAAVGRYPQDGRLARLVSRLRAESPEFERHWAGARVAEHRSSRKTYTGTAAGPITVDCDTLSVPDGDLRVVVYTVAPGSADEARLDLLRVTGLELFPSSALSAAQEPAAGSAPGSVG